MDYKFSCVTDSKGQYVRRVLVLLPEGEAPQVQEYALWDGEKLVDAVPPIIRPHAGAAGFISPKWDGSTWTEGATAKEIAAWEKAHPGPVLTLEQVVTDKLAEINAGCDAAIAAGCSVTLSDGTAGHLALTLPDQINLSTAQAAILAGGSGYAYHLDGALCEIYPAADIAIMAKAATAHILYHQTYCNHIRAWCKRCETTAEVQAITYGAELPEDLAAHMAAVLSAAEGGNG